MRVPDSNMTARSENSELVLQPGVISGPRFNPSDWKQYGIKGVHLLGLPPLWTPPFFLISTLLYKRYKDIIDPAKLLLFDHIVTSEERHELEIALKELVPSENDFVIVRSSAVDERLEYRGRYRSHVCMGTVSYMASSIQDVFASCPKDSGPEMALIMQRYVQPCRARGHLSNERRVSKYISSWLCEFDVVSGAGAPHVFSFSSSPAKPALENTHLFCGDRKSLVERLKEVGAWAQSKRLRLHFEWLWDGSKLWLLQVDQETENKGEHPLVRGITPKATSPRSLSVMLGEVNVPKGIWQKIDCVKTFRESGLPTTDLWVLRDEKVLLCLHSGECPACLSCDLEKLLEAPIVIRMDISNRATIDEFMLPRTDTVSSLELAKEFLINAARQVAEERIAKGDLCFIIHRFIPSRSSAFALADPKRARVKIDGIWGLPDGLAFYPHDSYDLSVSDADVIKHIRCKQDYLGWDERGQWVPKSAGIPLDWQSSLEEEELKQIARGTFAIARAVGKPVQVMWFVGIPEGLGHPDCIPWYYCTQQVPKNLVTYSQTLTQTRPIIRNREDLCVLSAEVKQGQPISAIRLRPVPELLRSKEFIKDVATLAKNVSVCVDLEGSVLSHAFYLLKNFGVNVRCPDLFVPELKPKRFNKLVRDLVPVRISSAGEHVKVYRITGVELLSVLKAKVIEEALELFWSDTCEQSKEEIVDLLEVLKAICYHQGFTDEELHSLAKEKLSKRGGFTSGIVLSETQEIPLINEAPFEPNLFDRLDSAEGLTIEVPPGHKARTIGPTPRLAPPELFIPLIPIDPRYRHFTQSFTFRNCGISVNVRFREKDIVIEVSKLSSDGSQPDPRQLKLFDF